MSRAIRRTHALRTVMAVFLDESPTALAGANIMNRSSVLAGTLYPLLGRLQDGGYLVSHWEDADPTKIGRPLKKFYKLTPLGKRLAEECTDDLRDQMSRWPTWLAPVSRMLTGGTK